MDVFVTDIVNTGYNLPSEIVTVKRLTTVTYCLQFNKLFFVRLNCIKVNHNMSPSNC